MSGRRVAITGMGVVAPNGVGVPTFVEALLAGRSGIRGVTVFDPASLPNDGDAERAALAAIKTFQTSGNGYFVEMATRPQTIGYALLDSPAALAAWMIDHDTDAYYKIARAFLDGQPSGNLTRDHVLDNITLYWLTGTGASAARSYWEAYGADAPAAGSPAARRARRLLPGSSRRPHLARRAHAHGGAGRPPEGCR